jgi:hypothetical protein
MMPEPDDIPTTGAPRRYPTLDSEAAGVTATTSLAGAAAMAGLATYSGSIMAIVLASIFALAGIYEWAAIYTDRVPTITDVIKSGGWPVRIAVVVLATLGFVDHFLTGVIL